MEDSELPELPEPFDLPDGEHVYHFVAGNMHSVEFAHPIPEGSVFGRPEKFSANDTYCMSAHDIASAVTFSDLFTERQMLDYARSAVLQERERLAEATELADTAMRFVDRAGDVCDIDPAERICAEFHKAMSEVVGKYHPMPAKSLIRKSFPLVVKWPGC